MKKKWPAVLLAVLLFGLLLGACPIADPVVNGGSNGGSNGGGSLPRVVQPVITRDPNRIFNDGPIEITLSTTTEGANLYYTIDGTAPSATNGTRYTGPFDLDMDMVPSNPVQPGYINLQVVGVMEGYNNSLLATRGFQLFEPEPFETSGGSAFGLREGTGYYGGNIRVGITIGADGYISSVSFDNGWDRTPEDTGEYFSAAVEHTEAFFIRMNHWDFDTVNGATLSSINIRLAAKEAIEKILEENP